MRYIGAILLVLGLMVGAYGLMMETTVTTERVVLDGVELGGDEVYNIGLQQDQRNTLIVAGVMVVLGGIFLASGNRQTHSQPEPDAHATRQCPQCAEYIKREAKVCRFCGADMTPLIAKEQALEHARQERENALQSEEQARRQAVADSNLKERAEWRSAHPWIGWLPFRNSTQLAVTAALVVLVGLVTTSLLVRSARENARLERLSLRHEQMIQRVNSLKGKWETASGDGYLMFSIDADGNRSLTIHPREAQTGKFVRIPFEAPADNRLRLHSDHGQQEDFFFETKSDGALSIRQFPGVDATTTALASYVIGDYQKN